MPRKVPIRLSYAPTPYLRATPNIEIADHPTARNAHANGSPTPPIHRPRPIAAPHRRHPPPTRNTPPPTP
ncbi:MAG: hypothetical protein ACK5XD_04280, partial [Acidobacteriota bacterium]